ncbi:MAG: hypothetical protein IPO58_24195 [Betaproteobacteria bacterium]|nr:hypothetical protein [Betaproteobacteria bacterium]
MARGFSIQIGNRRGFRADHGERGQADGVEHRHSTHSENKSRLRLLIDMDERA